MFDELARRAGERYRGSGRTAYHFAHGKLKRDPVYRALWTEGWLRTPGTLVDVGCGGGLALALIAAAREAGEGGPNRLVGGETRAHAARVAEHAVGDVAEIVTADARSQPLPTATTLLVLDVMHMMPAADQDALRDAMVAALEPGGVLILRDVDADAGWRFRAVKYANTAKALLFRSGWREFHFRSAAAWRLWLEEAGLTAQIQPMGRGTPFGNVLLVGRKR